MSDLTGTPTAEPTPFCAGQLELFRPPGPRITIDYDRPDGGPLTGEDYALLARLARAATGPERG